MYRITIHGCTDEFAEAVHGKEFNRRGLIRFLSRHIDNLENYEFVAVSRDYGPARTINFFYVGKKHMSDRIPTNRIFHL